MYSQEDIVSTGNHMTSENFKYNIQLWDNLFLQHHCPLITYYTCSFALTHPIYWPFLFQFQSLIKASFPFFQKPGHKVYFFNHYHIITSLISSETLDKLYNPWQFKFLGCEIGRKTVPAIAVITHLLQRVLQGPNGMYVRCYTQCMARVRVWCMLSYALQSAYLIGLQTWPRYQFKYLLLHLVCWVLLEQKLKCM